MTIDDYIKKLQGQVSRLPEARLYALRGAAVAAHNGPDGLEKRIHEKKLAADMNLMKRGYSEFKKRDYRRGDRVPYIELRQRYGKQTQAWDLEFTGTLRNELKVLHKRSEGSPFMFGGPNFVAEITTRTGPDDEVNIVKMTVNEWRIQRPIFKLSAKEREIFIETFAKLFAPKLFRTTL